MVEEANKARRENMRDGLLVAKCANPQELMDQLSDGPKMEPMDAWAQITAMMGGKEAADKLQRARLAAYLIERSKKRG